MSDELDINELSEMWRGHRAESQSRRARNRLSSAQILRDHHVSFTEHNRGAHLVVTHTVNSKQATVDFWPGTGKWMIRNSTIGGRGVYVMLKMLGVEVKEKV